MAGMVSAALVGLFTVPTLPMEPDEAQALVLRAYTGDCVDVARGAGAPQQCATAQRGWASAGLPELTPGEISGVSSRQFSQLWGGMGGLFELAVPTASGDLSLICKRFVLPRGELSLGDARKRDSFEVCSTKGLPSRNGHHVYASHT